MIDIEEIEEQSCTAMRAWQGFQKKADIVVDTDEGDTHQIDVAREIGQLRIVLHAMGGITEPGFYPEPTTNVEQTAVLTMLRSHSV